MEFPCHLGFIFQVVLNVMNVMLFYVQNVIYGVLIKRHIFGQLPYDHIERLERSFKDCSLEWQAIRKKFLMASELQ